MGANFPGAMSYGGRYEVPHKAKPTPIIGGASRVYLPYQPMATIDAVEAEWNPVTEEQQEFLNDMARSDAAKLPELKVKVSTESSEIKDFLGIDIPRKISEAEIIASSLLHVKLNWQRKGYRRVIHRTKDEGLWQGFTVRDATFYQVSSYDFQDIAKLQTEYLDEVFIQRWVSSPADCVKHVLETIPKMKKISLSQPREKDGKRYYYDEVRVPNIKLDRTFTDTPLDGMWFKRDGVKHKVDGFCNKIELDMNYLGVEVKSYSSYGLPGVYSEVITDTPRAIEFKVDQPFLMWIHRRGMKMPYFIGHITEQDWVEIDW